MFVVFEAVFEKEKVAVFVVVVAFFFEVLAEERLDFWEGVVGEVWEEVVFNVAIDEGVAAEGGNEPVGF